MDSLEPLPAPEIPTAQRCELWKEFAPQTPQIALVIGTYSAVPFVHLHLELAARTGKPVLVHDDASPEAPKLSELCRHYGAEFVCARKRSGHTAGDLRAFARGLEWAGERGFDWLVKFSRRFVPLYDFELEVTRNAQSYPFPTQSSYHVNDGYEFGFLTEATALHVGAWTAPLLAHEGGSALDLMREREKENPFRYLVEAWMHDRAREVCQAVLSGEIEAAGLCRTTLAKVRREEARHERWDSYAFWPIAGGDRTRSTAGALWHSHPDAPARYEALAQRLGLPYTAQDFDAHRTNRGT